MSMGKQCPRLLVRLPPLNKQCNRRQQPSWFSGLTCLYICTYKFLTTNLWSEIESKKWTAASLMNGILILVYTIMFNNAIRTVNVYYICMQIESAQVILHTPLLVQVISNPQSYQYGKPSVLWLCIRCSLFCSYLCSIFIRAYFDFKMRTVSGGSLRGFAMSSSPTQYWLLFCASSVRRNVCNILYIYQTFMIIYYSYVQRRMLNECWISSTTLVAISLICCNLLSGLFITEFSAILHCLYSTRIYICIYQ